MTMWAAIDVVISVVVFVNLGITVAILRRLRTGSLGARQSDLEPRPGFVVDLTRDGGTWSPRATAILTGTVAVAFVAPGCAGCDNLRAELHRAERLTFPLFAVVDGDQPQTRAYADQVATWRHVAGVHFAPGPANALPSFSSPSSCPPLSCSPTATSWHRDTGFGTFQDSSVAVWLSRRRDRRSARAFASAIGLAWSASPRCFVASAVLALLSGVASVPAAWATKLLVNDLVHRDSSSLARVAVEAASAALLAMAGVALSFAAGIATTWLTSRVQIRTQSALAAACALPAGTAFLDSPAEQDRIRLAQGGAHEAPQGVLDTVVRTVGGAGAIVGYAVVLLISWPWMLLAMLATAVPLALIHHRMTQRTIAVSRAAIQSYRWSEYYRDLFSSPNAAQDMRVCGVEDLLATRVRTHLATALDSEARQHAHVAKVQILFTLLDGVVAAAGAVVVAAAVFHGTVTVGDFTLFTAAVAAVLGQLSGLLSAGSALGVSLGLFGDYLDVVSELRQAGRTEQAKPAAPRLVERVQFRDVWFRYPNSDTWALRGATFSLDKGRTHALVGENGAGKSTVVRLLFRFYEPTRGAVLWDGVDIGHFDARSVREHIAGILQDFATYEMTAGENISIGDRTRFGDHVAAARASERAGIQELIERLPHGLATMLSTRRTNDMGHLGVNLSGGEWQRVALARSLMKEDPGLLVMDEPNSGLDPAAEARLQRRLMGVTATQTRLQISYRLGGLKEADTIIVLQGGRVAEQGTHSELMERGGVYARLFRTQAAPYNVHPAATPAAPG